MSARFQVHDRGASVAKEFHRFSTMNPRYAIIDTETREVVDELTTKSVATATARDMNKLAAPNLRASAQVVTCDAECRHPAMKGWTTCHRHFSAGKARS